MAKSPDESARRRKQIFTRLVYPIKLSSITTAVALNCSTGARRLCPFQDVNTGHTRFGKSHIFVAILGLKKIPEEGLSLRQSSQKGTDYECKIFLYCVDTAIPISTSSFATPCLLLLSGLLARTVQGQAPGLVWTANVGAATLFATDAQTNLYANSNCVVIKLDGNGLPIQTNLVCKGTNLLSALAARDAAGNYYFAGAIDGTNDFGGVTLFGGWLYQEFPFSPGVWRPGFPGSYLAKYGPDGSLQWVNVFATSSGAFAGISYSVTSLLVDSDGSVDVGYFDNHGLYLKSFTSSGTNFSYKIISNNSGGPTKITMSGIMGTNGAYLSIDRFGYAGGFYDASRNLTSVGYFWVFSGLRSYARPFKDNFGNIYLAGRPDPYSAQVLRKYSPGGSIVLDSSLGAIDQWVVAGDSGGYLYLTGVNGLFSKYNSDGIPIWSTNYGTPVITMLLDSQGNRFLQFTNNDIARLASDPPPVAPAIPIPPQPQTVFAGSNVTLTATISGTPPLHYAWQQDGTNIPSATNSVLNLNGVTTAQSGLYTIIVTNALGSATSAPPALLRVKSVELYLGSQLLTNGTYTFASPPTLTIRSAFAGGSSFYTLDGSAPNFSGTYYTGPFTLTQSATVRAIGYSSDFFQSEEADTVNAIVLVNHTLSVTSSGGGSVTLNPPGGTYVSTNVVTATAAPSGGNSFLYWLGDAAGASPSVNISMERDKSIRAVFGTSLSTTVSGSGQIQLFPAGGLYPYGSVVRLTAIPDAGNYFGFWGSAATGNTNPLYFTIAAPTQTVSSIFGATPGGQAALTVLISGDGHVNASPRANAYTLNQSVNLTAVPDSGQSFLGWNGDAGGAQNPLPVTMSVAKVITASFTARPTLRVDRTGLEGQSPEGFRLTLVSDPGNVFQIFGSTDLAVWIGLGVVSNSYGEVQFTDTNSPSFIQRYYKAAQ